MGRQFFSIVMAVIWAGWGGGHAEKGRGIFFKVCRIVVGRPLNFILEKKYNNKDKY